MEKNPNQPAGKGKIIDGTVVSAKTPKTVIVSIEQTFRHPLYKKILRRTKRIPAHNELSQVAVGSRVRLQEVRPMSKTKHFTVIGVV